MRLNTTRALCLLLMDVKTGAKKDSHKPSSAALTLALAEDRPTERQSLDEAVMCCISMRMQSWARTKENEGHPLSCRAL